VQADRSTEPRGKATLKSNIARGQNVGIVLEAPELHVDEPRQELEWTGETARCSFLVTAPADARRESYQLRARIFLDQAPIGYVRFTISVVDADTSIAVAAVPVGEVAYHYGRVFLSYASADRLEVLKSAKTLKAANIEFFQDILELEPGERWERRLFEEIEKCDLFLLFWSSHAARSEWVLREVRHALAQQNSSKERLPHITPVALEGPPVPLPPDELKHLHFNDVLTYVIAAVRNELAVKAPDALS
jgi:hypothetical protein